MYKVYYIPCIGYIKYHVKGQSGAALPHRRGHAARLARQDQRPVRAARGGGRGRAQGSRQGKLQG